MSIIQLPSYTRLTSTEFNYGVSLINAPDFWEKGIEGKGVNIAVIDSGCNKNHPELSENIIDGFNFTEDDNGDTNNITDYLGHGTHTAGIIAGQNKTHIIGVAPKANLVILKVIGKDGRGNYDSLVRAINFAVAWQGKNNEKIDVINLSLGGPNEDDRLLEAIHTAIKSNITIVAAAGNSGDGNEQTNEILYPGFYEEVIQVSAIDQNKQPTSFSNTNLNIDFLAPGELIYSTHFESFAKLSGTSMAAPHATGAIALLINFFKANNISPTRERIYEYLSSHSIALDGYTRNTQGYGVIQL